MYSWAAGPDHGYTQHDRTALCRVYGTPLLLTSSFLHMLQLNYNLLTCTLGLVQTARLVHDLDAEAREATGLEPPGRY